MRKNLTTEEFIEKAKKVHNDKYDYSKVQYINMHEKVEIYCKKCKKYFWQTPCNHLNGQGCYVCSKRNISKKYSLKSNEFIERAKKIHGYKYIYDLSNYIDGTHKIKIKCKKCEKIFEQTPLSHLSGRGCRNCASLQKGIKLRSNLNKFIKKLQRRGFNDKFDFSEAIYTTAIQPLTVICKKCGHKFKMTPHSLLAGSNCPYYNSLKPKYNELTTEKFIQKAIQKHHSKYDYSQVEYIGYNKKVKIYCKKCKKYFLQTPATHLNGSGCSFCNESKGEIKIYNILIEKKINFIKQKRFKDCKNKKSLPFDFYLPDYNICIEFQGKQHYQEGTIFDKTKTDFEYRQRHDQIKRDYCISHGIKLVEIRYDDNINEVIDNILSVKE